MPVGAFAEGNNLVAENSSVAETTAEATTAEATETTATSETTEATEESTTETESSTESSESATTESTETSGTETTDSQRILHPQVRQNRLLTPPRRVQQSQPQILRQQVQLNQVPRQRPHQVLLKNSQNLARVLLNQNSRRNQ